MKRNNYVAIILTCLVACVVVAYLWMDFKKIETKKQTIGKLAGIAQNINNDFVKIREEVESLARFTTSLYEDDKIKKNLINADTSKYRLAENGVFYKLQNDGGTAVFVSGYVLVTEDIKEIVYFTEPIDAKLIEIVKEHPEVVQAYYNDKNSYNRIYPYFDVLTQYEPKMNIPAFNFYYLADQVHNPSKKGVWVDEPYVDPAGRGWMVSAIAPVYVNGYVEGVPGLDVTILTITERYIKEIRDNLMIVDQNGVVVSTNEYMANLFSLPPLKEHKYLETIKSDTYLVDQYNLLKSKSPQVREMAFDLLRNNKNEEIFQNDSQKVVVIADKIPELRWTILSVVN